MGNYLQYCCWQNQRNSTSYSCNVIPRHTLIIQNARKSQKNTFLLNPVRVKVRRYQTELEATKFPMPKIYIRPLIGGTSLRRKSCAENLVLSCPCEENEEHALCRIFFNNLPYEENG